MSALPSLLRAGTLRDRQLDRLTVRLDGAESRLNALRAHLETAERQRDDYRRIAFEAVECASNRALAVDALAEAVDFWRARAGRRTGALERRGPGREGYGRRADDQHTSTCYHAQHPDEPPTRACREQLP